MRLIQVPAACTDSDSQTCAFVYDVTGDSKVADISTWIIGKPLAIVGLILVGIVARWIVHRLIDRVIRRAEKASRTPKQATSGLAKVGALGERSARHGQRVETMGSLLKSISTGVIFTVVVVMVISELGYDVAPLIAGAGILGVAIGFGSQALVKDFLSGIFMIFEDQYGVGDEVDLGEAYGVVEAVSLRVTRLRDINGAVWYVRNGEILRVGNMSQNFARSLLDVPVGYSEDIGRVKEILSEVGHTLIDDPTYGEMVLAEPDVKGVQSLDPDSVLVRMLIKTLPGQQWAVTRELRERIKERFDVEGIEIPLPQRVVWHRDVSGSPRTSAGADDLD
ncbi:mechanosensitive ion channel protein MscS [Marmoricola endophyticus]|uniref:Mechanosensitive ion channel protein MscS n=1 Tax=Marmoricola endophyticus TaxID=2040280 RepID=A0A917BVH8_9ACTN|nr:mechanosensitive ion channel family protein [Marmoricola endophyticus]GGF57916.1 mechanosensitive ion channel protein MscS [Marmoricola endophyticus]